jgi:hypothetical protein
VQREIPAKTQDEIRSRLAKGEGPTDIARSLRVSTSTVSKYRHIAPTDQETKKLSSFHWRDAIPAAKELQKLKSKASRSQDYATIELGDGKSPVILMGFGDQHVGAYGCNYDKFAELTDEILNTPNLYVALMGDTLEMAIRLRGVLEVTAQVLTPEMQELFLDSWLEDIKSKVAFAVWDNHAIMRQENLAGSSGVKNILSKNVIYHNGIGHQDLKVGNQVYYSAASHKFRGNSMFNRMHAQGRYVRQEANDRELVLMGDIHTFGFTYTEDGGKERVYITGGTLHENSGYAKRFFSLKTSPHFPCVVLMPDKHEMIPFKTIGQALRYIGK